MRQVGVDAFVVSQGGIGTVFERICFGGGAHWGVFCGADATLTRG